MDSITLICVIYLDIRHTEGSPIAHNLSTNQNQYDKELYAKSWLGSSAEEEGTLCTQFEKSLLTYNQITGGHLNR